MPHLFCRTNLLSNLRSAIVLATGQPASTPKPAAAVAARGLTLATRSKLGLEIDQGTGVFDMTW
jgi:hypothetical protein